MIDVVVSLGMATICFAGQCHPALIGAQTPIGQFPIVHAQVLDPAYGGDVLAYARRKDGRPLAIHRVWTQLPQQHRVERLASARAAERRGVTGGCINVMPDVFEKLVDCCSNQTLRIQP